MNEADDPAPHTDLQHGLLAPADREMWLHNYSQDLSDWTDEDILAAMGADMN